MNKLNKKAFTLIELIVVMAIIGILVLLAAPRFLGYTKDANVTAMKADAKMLSNIALQYNVEKEVWPTTGTALVPSAAITAIIGAGNDILALNPSISTEYKNLKNPIGEYGLVTEGVFEGEVFHLAGVADRADVVHYGVKN